MPNGAHFEQLAHCIVSADNVILLLFAAARPSLSCVCALTPPPAFLSLMIRACWGIDLAATPSWLRELVHFPGSGTFVFVLTMLPPCEDLIADVTEGEQASLKL